MKGKLLLAILLLAPLCCVVETTAEDDDDEPSCNETGCIELGLCNYTDECRCRLSPMPDLAVGPMGRLPVRLRERNPATPPLWP
jgi:hypothetical protein